MSDSPLGTSHLDATGRSVLVFTRALAHPVAKVWRAVTDAEHLRAWFADVLDYDRSDLPLADGPGTALRFVPRADLDGVPTTTGRILRSEPPQLLEYTWGDEVLRWELAATGGRTCTLTFTNVFDDRDFAGPNAMGWHAGLDRLADHLAGRDPRPTPLENDEAAAAALLARYEDAFVGRTT